MLDKVIHFSIHNKLIVGLFTLALIVWGVFSVTQLPIDAVPDITNNQVQVITASPSLATQEVERLITYPIEVTMATIPDIEEIRSFSRFGLSVVTIVFKDKVDVYWARQQVNERLSEAEKQIPEGVGTPELAPVTTGLGEIYQYLIHPKKGYEKKYDATELRSIQDWIVRRQLLGTPGVADVSSFGGFLKQYEIAIDPQHLKSMNVSIAEIFTALERNNQNTGGAYIDKRPNAYFIRTQGLITNLDEIGQVVVKNRESGVPVLIRDVAKVQFGHATRYGAMTRNAEGEVVGGIVMMLKDANASKVIGDVKERIATISKSLPEGVEIEPFLDRTKLVNNSINTVTKNLAEGALIVIFVLVLFLGNLRAGLVVASVIPLAMLFAISMMNLFGVSGNLMSLGAIDFGLIVDGAVIIVESIVHRITTITGHTRLNQQQMDKEVYGAASKIRNSAAFGEIIILIVYLPILALVGIEGKMFGPMAQTVAFAILGAFLLSLTYVPMMSALFLSKKTTHKRNISDKLMDFFQRGYDPLIRFALQRKAIIVFTAAGLFAISYLIFSRMGGEFIPTLSEGDFAVETRVLTGSSMMETVDASQKAAAILLKEFPEVKEVVSKIGSSEIPTDPMPVEAADMMVILKDQDEWTTADNRDELANMMAKALEDIPGVTFGFQQPIQMRFNELMTGAKQDVVLKIYGEDLETLSREAEKVGKLVQTVEGAEDVYVETVTGLPQIQVNYNRGQLAKFGLAVEDVNQVVQTAFAGQVAGQIYEGEKKFDLVVRLDQENRQGIEDVQQLFIATPNGHQIPLSQVAEVSFQPGPYQIQRDDTKRRITVAFNVRNRDVESVVNELRTKVESQIKLPVGYHVSYGGQFENLIEARQRLGIAVPVALGLIFILLFFTFNSVKQSLLIFTAIPLSAIGGILALSLRGMPFSISAGIGFIALFGVAVLNGIVLIGEFNNLKASGMTDIYQRVIEGTKHRLRPVLMTASVASLGFLPMALSGSAGAEVQRPLATVVIGGLISATLLTLLVLPVLYVYFEKGFKNPKGNSTAGLATIALMLLCILPSIAGAQDNPVKRITLNQAIDQALQNNGTIRSANYEIELQQALRKTASGINKTDVGLTYGQYNSSEKDNNFTIGQTIPFPTVWGARAKLADANIKGSEIQKNVTANELIRQVKETYYQLVFLEAQHKVLQHQDSLISTFVQAAQVRYRTGETTYLEQVTAESEAARSKVAMNRNGSEIKANQVNLQFLLNTKEPVTVAEDALIIKELAVNAATAAISNNPNLIYLRQQIEIAKQAISLEKAELLPDLRLGYFNQSLIGSTEEQGGTVKRFGSGDRFQGVEVGVSIPLWLGPTKANVKAAEIREKIAQSNLDYNQKTIQGQYAQLVQQFLQYQASLQFYQQNALPQANLITSNATLAFRSGEIGYLEFIQALNRAQTIRTEHLELLNQYNQAAIAVEFFTGNQY
ncbi:CusA/CzcA family heavy metal efflux RND transporter [Adhaeribacter sp. BT258]|uniref:CusA/CzcA family heavy metal efflux RND transporter n=1 Tax=Adhaeribacter terrigena TaxID=2793070 RepID=A0ABS1BXK4_9BACT|nr:CusA/CzcA family heavy metal efflux RND transporter [Adhaeribacter terrigena]MBK0401877.1 CusA/CzcA family heavy metal efflux RND transporter [Adhaeribacter terrigena]